MMKRTIIFIGALFFGGTPLAAVSFPEEGLKGTYNNLPTELQMISPIHAAIIIDNEELTRIWKSKEDALGELAQSMFRELDGKIQCVRVGSNPVSVLDNQLIQQLIEYSLEGTRYANLIPSAITFNEAPSTDGKSKPLTGWALAW